MTGEQLKEQGQQRALQKAGDDWTEKTLKKLSGYCDFLKALGHREFKFEMFRLYCEIHDWPAPPKPNCWGAIATIAAKRKLIRDTGRYEPAESRRTHAHPVKVWEAL